MKNIEAMKRRLLREAIQSNIEAARRIRTKPSIRPQRLIPLWVWSFFLLGALTYFLVSSPSVSTDSNSPPHVIIVKQTQPPAPVGDQAVEPEIPQSPPQRLSRVVVPLSVKRIVIDPGHGGKQHGAISESGVAEKEVTLDVGLRLRRLMEKAPFEVLMTRETDKTLSLEKRAAFANAHNADLFVSIHVNWMEPRDIRPLETYYVGPSDNAATLKLVAMENRESGYSLADYRQLLDKIFIDARRDESHRLAETINAELYRSLSQINPDLENRGVKMAPFLVLVGTLMPAILVEISCLSNEDEVRLLTSGDYREKAAAAILEGIRSYADKLNGLDKKDS